RPLTEEAYDSSRWIVEPWRLFDCCQENDGAAALIVVPAEEARDFQHKLAYLLCAAQGSECRHGARGHNAPLYATSSFTTLAPHHVLSDDFARRRTPVLWALRRASAYERGATQFLQGDGGQRLLYKGEPRGAARPPAAQFLGRQSGGVLLARRRVAGRSGPPA